VKRNYLLGKNIEDGLGVCKKCNTKRFIHHQDKKEIVYACKCLKSKWAVLYRSKPCKICGKSIRLPNNQTSKDVEYFKQKMTCGNAYGRCYKKYMSLAKMNWKIKSKTDTLLEFSYCQNASCKRLGKLFARSELENIRGLFLCKECVTHYQFI